MSEDKNNTEEINSDENSPEQEPDLSTAWGKFISEKQDPDSQAYFMEGLLAQTDPRLKSQLTEDYKRLFKVADVFGGLMNKIMATPEGQRQFEKELDKFVVRRTMSENTVAKEDTSDDQEDT